MAEPVEFRPKNFTRFRRFTQLTAALFLQYAPYRRRYKSLLFTGRENLPAGEETFLIVANHLSNWDPPLLVMATHKPMGFLAKLELYQDWRVGLVIEFLGAISVKREKPEVSTVKSVRKIFQAGWSLAMFIEGTRSRTPGVFGRPHLGPAYFARSNKARILPVGIIGSNLKGGDVQVRIGKPMDYAEDLEETTWRIMEALAALTGFKIEHRELAQPGAED